MNRRFLGRIRILTLVCILGALCIVGRLYLLQVIRGSAYIQRADAQFTNPDAPLVDRGTIYFTAKDGTLITAATMKEGYSLALNPMKVTSPQSLFALLGTTTGLSYADFFAKATKPGTQYQLLADHIEGDPSSLISQQIPGLIISDDRWRFYPGGSLAAQEVGFVAYDSNNTETGQYGLEKEYDATLDRNDDDLYSNFFVQLFGGVKSVLQGQPQEGDIVTTIEPTVQVELEQEIAAYDAQWHPKLAGGIIMNPQNGEIYAMAVSPSFDLNTFGTEANPLIYQNPMVQNVYEMGSIIKPLTMAAGIDSGAITPTETYDDTGCITVDKSKICNWDFKARGVIPMQQVLSQSLNVGASFIATQMGTTTMRDYFLNHYELGLKTGIDLPGEVPGIVRNLSTPQQVDYDTAAFGQGIGLTPIETVRALATISNGGLLVTPHLVRAIRYTTGVTQTLTWPKPVRVLKEQTALDVSQMLTVFTDQALYQGKYSFPHYSVGTKTGTAQVADPVHGGYYSDTYLHSYVSFLPSTNANAKFIIFLFAYEPVGATYSDQTWTSYWHDITQFLINYYDIPPDR